MSTQGSDFEGLAGTPPSTPGGRAPRGGPVERRERARMIAAGVLGGLVVAFALVNLGDVKVHWIVTTGHTPLIVVIGLAFLLGMLVDRLIIRARRKRAGG